MTKFTNRKEIRYVCGNRLGFHIFIISTCSRNVKYILTKIRSCARQLFARCRGGDSRARRCTCSPYKPPSKWQTPPICHCEEAKGRRGALSAKREEVPLGCNLGKAVAFSPIAFPRCGRVLRDCHVASLLAMTRQGNARCTSALLPLNIPYKAVTDRRYTPYFGVCRFHGRLYGSGVRSRERHAAPLQCTAESLVQLSTFHSRLSTSIPLFLYT